ncbi:MBL fold metallo-hydrolase [Candidatus Saccharibacteria bacterium]|nr:MBL fold metallo-hydrolase [Candidatus Saccharibacteria bacterium]
MDLTYLGAGAVKLSSKNLTVVCDPYTKESGLPTINVRAEVVTKSGPEGFGEVSGATISFDQPGEYEAKGVSIKGVPAQLHTDETGERGTVFAFDMDGTNVIVVGNIAGKLDDRKLERLGQADVLVVPVGGFGLTLDAAGAAELVTQFEPSYVVPVHYDDGKTVYPMPQAGVDEFLKEMGATGVEPIAKLKINSKEMPPETQIVVLQRA